MGGCTCEMGKNGGECRGSVPVVDVGALMRSELSNPRANFDGHNDGFGEDVTAIITAVDGFCRTGSGGLILVNHGFENELNAAMDAARAFHAAPMDIKMAHAAHGTYDPVGQVKVAVRPASLHERMSYPRVVYTEDSIGGVTASDIATVECNDGTDRSPPTPIDSTSPHLFTVEGVDAPMRAFQRCIMRLSLALLRATAIALGLPPTYFDCGWARSNSAINAIYYVPLLSPDGAPTSDGYFGQRQPAGETAAAAAFPEATEAIGDLGARMRVYPHADDGAWFTLLVHDRVEGLQVLEERGGTNWIDVERVSGHQIVLQVGQLMQRFSNDAYHCTPHRVLLPSFPVPARTTLTFFYRPHLDMALEVPPLLRQRPNDAGGVYETITVRKFITLGRVDSNGSPLKLTSDILKDGSWIHRDLPKLSSQSSFSPSSSPLP